MVKKIGITGNIGSGKTTVCRIFQLLNVPVYNSDDAAKWLMQKDTELMDAIKAAFGADMYDGENRLNRPKMAQLVFNDKDALKRLEGLVHPAVFKHGADWAAQYEHLPYVLKEAALTFESGSYRFLDAVIVVHAPESVRLERVMARDGVEEAAVRARMNRQLSDEEKLERADYVVYNDGEQMLIPQILKIHEVLSSSEEKGRVGEEGEEG